MTPVRAEKSYPMKIGMTLPRIMQFGVGATNVRTGAPVYFDNHRRRIDAGCTIGRTFRRHGEDVGWGRLMARTCCRSRYERQPR